MIKKILIASILTLILGYFIFEPLLDIINQGPIVKLGIGIIVVVALVKSFMKVGNIMVVIALGIIGLFLIIVGWS